jgi:hypothetical protein
VAYSIRFGKIGEAALGWPEGFGLFGSSFNTHLFQITYGMPTDSGTGHGLITGRFGPGASSLNFGDTFQLDQLTMLASGGTTVLGDTSLVSDRGRGIRKRE